MTKSYIPFILALLSILMLNSNLFSQIQFEQVGATPPAPAVIADLDHVSKGSVDFGDIDGDNDPDLLMTGFSTGSDHISKLYMNDGSGNFSEILNTPFDGVDQGEGEFADFDGDGDLDIIITGNNQSNVSSTKLYFNDGSGNYTEANTPYLQDFRYSAVDFADINGDNDLDLLINGGTTGGSNRNSIVYHNDGNGNFNESLQGLDDLTYKGDLIFIDYDLDNDQDIILTGYSHIGGAIARKYTNIDGYFYWIASLQDLSGAYESSIDYADIDGDNDPDVLISGGYTSAITNLYTNDGSGNFTLVAGTPFDDVKYAAHKFADVDGDNDVDVLLTGRNSASELIAKLYTNDGNGNFSLVANTPFTGVSYGDVAFADVDGDTDLDVVINGAQTAALYINDGSGVYTEVTNTPFTNVRYSSSEFLDFDNDNDMDVIISGSNNGAVIELYENNGNGEYSLVSGTTFDDTYNGSISVADVDEDNDVDILITGQNSSSQRVSKLYLNNSGVFTVDNTTPFQGLTYSYSAFADVDGDADEDVLICGYNASNDEVTSLYSNDGDGNFVLVAGTPFENVMYGHILFVDVDGDTDFDVLLSGKNASNQPITKLYSNNGSGVFSLVAGTPFENLEDGFNSAADIDNDGDQDLLITGNNSLNQKVANLYLNDGSGSFTLVAGTSLTGVSDGQTRFFDVDSDSDLDLLIMGYVNSNEIISELYINDGFGNYTEHTASDFVGLFYGSVSISDIDNDSDFDILLTGMRDSRSYSRLYKNTTTPIPNEVVWLGNTDNDWNTSANWNSNWVPRDIDNITIPNTATSYPTIDAASEVDDLTMESNASLKGQENLTINGDLSIEREISGYSSSSDGWHFLSSPVSNQVIAGSDFEPGYLVDDLYEWGESSELWLNFTEGTFGDTHFDVGKGYLVSYDNTDTKVFSGSFNTGSVTKNLSFTAGKGDGWNLLGNPYPSAIDWDLISRSTDVDDAAYIVNPVNGTYKSWVNGVGDIANGEIPVNQGFFVKANSGGQSVTMKLADQVHSSNTFNKSTNTLPENTMKISLNGTDSENNTYVRFKYDATNDFDSHSDAYKLFGFAVIPQVYTQIEDIDYAINSLNFSTEDISIPLGIYLNADEDLIFDFSGIEGFNSNTRIELEDKFENNIINLREQASYIFRGTASDEAERFLLHFSQVTGLENIEVQGAQVYAVDGRVYIRLEDEASYSQMTILDLSGRLISEFSINRKSLQSFGMNNLKGIYLVQLQGDNGSVTKKVTL